MDATHPDYPILLKIQDAIYARLGGADALEQRFPVVMREAIEYVIDPVRTARTRIAELDNVEKTFVGLKIEHYFRDLLDVPKGIRDLEIAGMNVDIKHTVRTTWMIPPETYRTGDPCVLIATADDAGSCSLGLILARDEYLNKPNRDAKRGVASFGRENILWVIRNAPFPTSRWEGIDMTEFRRLRSVRGGTRRATEFFTKYVWRPTHRSIVQALLHDQDDYMKRLRGNGGARDELRQSDIVLLSGAYDAGLAGQLGITLAHDEMMSARPRNPAERRLLLPSRSR